MRPRERRETSEQDLFRSRLDQIIDIKHALVKLARTIDWRFLEERFGAARRGVLPPSPAEKAPFHGHLRNHVTFFAQPRNVFAVARSLSGRATVRQPPTRQNARGGFS